jgi:hypothetical protein
MENCFASQTEKDLALSVEEEDEKRSSIVAEGQEVFQSVSL